MGKRRNNVVNQRHNQQMREKNRVKYLSDSEDWANGNLKEWYPVNDDYEDDYEDDYDISISEIENHPLMQMDLSSITDNNELDTAYDVSRSRRKYGRSRRLLSPKLKAAASDEVVDVSPAPVKIDQTEEETTTPRYLLAHANEYPGCQEEMLGIYDTIISIKEGDLTEALIKELISGLSPKAKEYLKLNSAIVAAPIYMVAVQNGWDIDVWDIVRSAAA